MLVLTRSSSVNALSFRVHIHKEKYEVEQGLRKAWKTLRSRVRRLIRLKKNEKKEACLLRVGGEDNSFRGEATAQQSATPNPELNPHHSLTDYESRESVCTLL